MKLCVGLALALLGVLHQVYCEDAAACQERDCAGASCRCSSKTSPLALRDTPQLIVLAFVDAVRKDLYEQRWSPLIETRKNPDDNYITTTFYVPHEYSDYQSVNDIIRMGMEIGVHSVSNEAHREYWRDATQELLQQEFGSQRKIISKFANIPEEYLTGVLTPQLELAGDRSINAFVNEGFLYDNSWPAKQPLYPYTLDYRSTQICDSAANCPKESHQGFWMAPIVDLIDENGEYCATLAHCLGSRSNQTADEVSNWLVSEVRKVKNSNRAPITLIVEERVFQTVNESWTGLINALDTLQEDKEIFFVSQARVIQWMKDPVPISSFQTNAFEIEPACVAETCKLQKDDNTLRYMVSCVPCPNRYPWLDNPEGK